MKKPDEIQTKEITDFTGRLTRKKNGTLNSGLAKFSSSFGYDPFSKPGQLTWFEQPVDIGGSVVVDLIVAAKQFVDPANPTGTYVIAIGSSKKLYRINCNSITNANLDTPSVIGTLSNGSVNFGASMEVYNTSSVLGNSKIFIGMDDRVTSINPDGSGETTIGTTNNYFSNVYRPLTQFVGKLVFGNKTNIGIIDSTGTITSTNIIGGSSILGQLSPTLPPETNITDLDISPDGNYLFMTSSGVVNENLTNVTGDRQASSASAGNIYKWNGVDAGATAKVTIPSYAVTALQTFLDTNMFFSDDSFGASISNGSQKVVTLQNNKSPFSNSTLINGNFISWIAPEVSPDSSTINASMYYFGNLDEENPKGLWRVLRYTTSLTGGYVYQTPVNLLTNNKYSTVNNAINSVVTLGYGKHYFSTYEINASNTTPSNTTSKFYRFLVTPTGSGTPQLGVWETQNELFGKKISIAAIRVYTEPTATGNGFQVDIIGSNGAVVTDGTFTYSYASGTDITLLQGALERINFNPNMGPLYSYAVRVTNTGTTNMTINKIEIDWGYSGK